MTGDEADDLTDKRAGAGAPQTRRGCPAEGRRALERYMYMCGCIEAHDLTDNCRSRPRKAQLPCGGTILLNPTTSGTSQGPSQRAQYIRIYLYIYLHLSMCIHR